MSIEDPETYWEEKAHQMLTLLKKCNFKDEIREDLEDRIFRDEFLGITDFKLTLDRYKKDIRNFK